MLVSLNWLREICDLSGVEASAVSAALTARGLTVDLLVEGADGPVLDIDVPANRPDALGHVGLARELSAAFGRRLLNRPAVPVATGEPLEARVRVAIDDPDLCPRYTVRVVRGVRVGASPASVVARLESCGLRAINNIVDASNLVLLETGHPIHTFDLSRLGGREIRVRRAAPLESLTTLDGVERVLEPDMLVIADATRPVALAGILGGAESEIGTSTRDVLIESAYFLPRSIRKTARRLGLSTDASHRFERGADPDAVLAAQELAVRLLVEMAGGEAAPGLIDAYPRPVIRLEVPLRPERVGRLLGFDPGREAIAAALAANGLSLRDGDGGTIVVRPPSWRVDLQREADLVEEVARHLGYDKIPEAAGTVSPSPRDPSGQAAEERCRTLLAHLGFHEAFSYAMIAVDEDVPFVPRGAPAPLEISNPIAETLARLRRSLMPGLVRSAGLNLRHGVPDVRLFELGRVFLRRDRGGFPEEPTRAAFAWAGAGSPRHWSARTPEADWPAACGIVDAVIRALRPDFPILRVPSGLEGLHPGRSAAWNSRDGIALAWCGELHPDLAHLSDLRARVLLGEVDLDRLLVDPETEARHAPVPRVPSVTRDLSLILDAGATWSRVIGVLSEVPAPAPVRFEALDRYEGEPLGPGEVSVTVRVILQPLDQTLTDVETEAYRRDLTDFLASRLQVRLRS